MANYLDDSFYSTPKTARQIMTYHQWQETAIATQCRILSCRETYKLTAKHMGGGMYEVRANLPYWEKGKPNKQQGGKSQ